LSVADGDVEVGEAAVVELVAFGGLFEDLLISEDFAVEYADADLQEAALFCGPALAVAMVRVRPSMRPRRIMESRSGLASRMARTEWGETSVAS
jgi:hypothetical protein